MKTRRFILLAVLLICGVAPRAYADGGQILLHQTSGAFEITAFAAPEPLSTGDADLSVLLQDRTSQQAILDANVSLTLQPPQGPPVTIALDQQGNGNRLMRSTRYRFDQPGRWNSTVVAYYGSEHSQASGSFDVAPSHSRRAIVWTFVSLPLVFVGLFAANQRLKSRQRITPPRTGETFLP
jgi:hypothetical protein